MSAAQRPTGTLEDRTHASSGKASLGVVSATGLLESQALIAGGCAEIAGAGVGAMFGRVPGSKANLRVFIEKLIQRRTRLKCKHEHYDAIRAALLDAVWSLRPAKAHPPPDAVPGDHGTAVAAANAPVSCGGVGDEYTVPSGAAVGGRLPYQKLKEVLLRTPPKSVPQHLLRSLVEVAHAYDDEGGSGSVPVDELLAGALEVEASVLARLWPFFPVIALLIWLALAPIVYCTVGGWNALDAFFFAAMVMLTIGQDTVVPGSDGLKIFSVLYVAVGVSVVAWGCASLALRITAGYETFVKGLLMTRDNADLLAADGHGCGPSSFALEDLVYDGTHARGPPEPCSLAAPPVPPTLCPVPAGLPSARPRGPSLDLHDHSLPCVAGGIWAKREQSSAAARQKEIKRDAVFRVSVCLLAVLIILLIGALAVYVWSPDASLADALYWSVRVCTTIGGTGPIEEEFTTGGKVFAVFFPLVAVPSCVAAVCGIAELALTARSARIENDILSRSFSMDLLIDLDADGSGISKLEFVCAALMAVDQVSAYELWQVLELFRRLDFDGSGFLCEDKLAALCPAGSPKRHMPPKRKGLGRVRVAVQHLAPPPQFEEEGPKVPLDAHPKDGGVDLKTAEAPLGSGGAAAGVAEGGPASPEVTRSAQGAGAQPSVADSGFQSLPEDQAASAMSSTLADSRRNSMVRFAPSVGEVLLSSEAPSTWRDAADASMRPRSEIDGQLLAELYQDTLIVRQQLGQKEAELVAALRAQQQTEATLRQVYAERQALHGEVQLLQHKIAELQARLKEEARLFNEEKQLRLEAEQAKAELQRKAYEAATEAEARRLQVERSCEEAEKEVKSLRERCVDAEAAKAKAETRAVAVEQDVADMKRKFEATEQRLALEADAKLQQMQKEYAELDFKRQGEIRSAMLELQAAAHEQHVLRTQFRRSQTPPPTLAFGGTQTQSALDRPKVRSGRQPWEVWELAASGWAARAASEQAHQLHGALLSGKARGQADLLESQIHKLAERAASLSAGSPDPSPPRGHGSTVSMLPGEGFLHGGPYHDGSVHRTS